MFMILRDGLNVAGRPNMFSCDIDAAGSFFPVWTPVQGLKKHCEWSQHVVEPCANIRISQEMIQELIQEMIQEIYGDMSWGDDPSQDLWSSQHYPPMPAVRVFPADGCYEPSPWPQGTVGLAAIDRYSWGRCCVFNNLDGYESSS